MPLASSDPFFYSVSPYNVYQHTKFKKEDKVKNRNRQEEYQGFEQGPIRPPSEAGSMLIRITRNCPWNRCTFCSVYKGSRFSLRPVDHVLQDIDQVHRYVQVIRERAAQKGKIYPDDIRGLTSTEGPVDQRALNSALHWATNGMRSIFLQDANSLIIKPADLIRILKKLQDCFPWVDRVTSYARSHTIARISDENLKLMADAGLSRIHVGMESGSDKVLDFIKKGVDKATHIKAGKKVKAAGMELSEYYMPGLGGRVLSADHALESADALNQINPHFIRLRTLAVPRHADLYGELVSGRFEKMGDIETARELLLFIQNLDGITSTLKSDHILNLFENLDGQFPGDKPVMTAMIEEFLSLPDEERMLYQVGRRIGLFRGLSDMANQVQRQHAENACRRAGITPDTIDESIDDLMRQFI